MRCWLIIPNPASTLNAPQPAGRLDRLERNPDRPRDPTVVGTLSSRQKPTYVYFEEDAARAAAEEWAISHPQEPVYIFESVGAIETGTPVIMNKRFNSSGELLPA